MEMDNYDEVPVAVDNPQPITNKSSIFKSFEDLLEEAAIRQYGPTIRVVKNEYTMGGLDKLTFQLSIDAMLDPEPRETRRAILDINMKEYTNHSDEVDETFVELKKTWGKKSVSRYNFSATKGSEYGVTGNIGAQLQVLSMVGGSASVGANHGKSKSETTGTEVTTGDTFELSYKQEEKITVPPKSKVKARITTHSMKYEQDFIVKYSVPSYTTVPVTYKTSLQQTFCGFYVRSITAAQLCCTLPDFKDEDGMVSYTQKGTLSWVGNGSTIDKVIEKL